MTPDDYLRAGLALLIGLLIGMQRERANEAPAGLRTFALIGLAGFLSGLLAEQFNGWIVVAGVIFLAAVFSVGNFIVHRNGADHHTGGITSEIAALIVYGIGVYLANDQTERSFAVLVAGVTALLLYYKKPMHEFVRGLGGEDVRAIMQFVLITLVILPVLPNQTYGPYDVVNPFNAWLMVVLIVGIGLAGFLVYRIAGSKVGTILSGLLGGMVSSTATSVSASRFAQGNSDRASAAALIIMIATTVSIGRILIELVAVNREDILQTGPPLLVFLLVFAILSFFLYRTRSNEMVELDPPKNPAQLKPAIIFGVLYVLILLAVAATKEEFGQSGLYVVAVISGLTDVDAITLSTAKLMSGDSLDVATGWRVILIAAIANTVFKGAIVGVVGDRHVFKRIATFYGISIIAGLLILFLWPESLTAAADPAL
ncbi:MAG: MgtC/SapB family protein [Verrucomicrobiales bacterium]|nr:MgtC/SapB family protein [Verrucomicrobiales bacterium]